MNVKGTELLATTRLVFLVFVVFAWFFCRYPFFPVVSEPFSVLCGAGLTTIVPRDLFTIILHIAPCNPSTCDDEFTRFVAIEFCCVEFAPFPSPPLRRERHA